MKTKSLHLSSGVTAHSRVGRERRDGEGRQNTMVKQYKAFFLTQCSKMEKIYIQHKNKMFLPLLYIMWGLSDPPLVHVNMVIKKDCT